MSLVRFTKPFWDGISSGTVTLAFRSWKKPTVLEGNIYRTGGGRVLVKSVQQVDGTKISDTDFALTGCDTKIELQKSLDRGDGRFCYRVEFELITEPDPREVLANSADLNLAESEEISKRLARFDAASKSGPWTKKILEMISVNPGRRAPDLAEQFGAETKAFKLNVRKLKNLGLTKSLKVGYELSPRGRAYLDL